MAEIKPNLSPPAINGAPVVAFLVWIVSLLAASIVVRIGWELGGRLWALL